MPKAKKIAVNLSGRNNPVWLSHFAIWFSAAVVGGATVALTIGSEYANRFIHHVLSISPFLPLLILPFGLVLIALLTKVVPGTQGSGIPQVIAAFQIEETGKREGLLSLKIALSKMGLTLLGLLAGASIGREGPSVQIGASIMYAFSKVSGQTQYRMGRALILAGGAAGVAGAFNTPVAGIVFAIEELSRSFEQKTSGVIITAVVMAGLASMAMMGNYIYFGHTSAYLAKPSDWLAVVVCGVTGGLFGAAFSKILLVAAKGLPGRAGHWIKVHPFTFAAVCGILLALIGLISHSTTYGTGYLEARQIVEGGNALPVYFGLLKMLATLISYLSGIPGGIFAPSLAVGAGLGSILSHLLPHTPGGAVIILGMAAYFTGVVQAPMTAFIIVMEMTDNHAMILPLMLTALIADGVSKAICPQPLYKVLATGFLEKVKGSGIGS